MKPDEGSHFDPEERLSGILETVGRILFYGGLIAVVGSVGFLIFTALAFGGGTAPASVDQARQNIELFQTILVFGGIALPLGAAMLFWGAEALVAGLLAGSAIVFFAPVVIPMFMPGVANAVGASAFDSLQKGGGILAVLSLGITAIDLFIRIRNRSTYGTRADQLKFGKGIKQERDLKNVFMGKCWQLPYCRKFVRERCPIFHSKRTCWRERVGCMCEEQVIQGAMENKAIPKDMVAAAKFIPRNNRLTAAEKFERCRQCVIYNEHQKHKYKLMLPIVLAAVIGIYAAFRPQLLIATGALMSGLDKVVSQMTLGRSTSIAQTMEKAPLPFNDILLICFTFIALTYALKLLEFLIFKVKL